MNVERFSHPGKRSNPEHHGTIDRYAVGCRCWRCSTAFTKFVKTKVQERDAQNALRADAFRRAVNK